MTRSVRLLNFVALCLSVAVRAGESPGVVKSPLDELLSTPISTAAKYDQSMGHVAASVTVITAEEIARYGWRSLSEVLTAVRSVYTTSDRGYTYLGVRGIGLPSDYNNRFLILVDGNPLAETVSGSIDVGTGLGVDMSTLERIEFVRGPGSVMYGTGAMFGVINLITKDERERASTEVSAGSGGLTMGRARVGLSFGQVHTSAAISWQEKNGGEHYFAEFDRPETNHGAVSGRDYDDAKSLIVTTRWKGLRLVALYGMRSKGVPTASWNTEFGADEQLNDGRILWALSHSHELGVGKTLSTRVFHDRFRYVGHYPLAAYDHSDRSDSTRLGGELRYVWDVRPTHRLTTGVEYVSNKGTYRWNEASGTIRSMGQPYAQFGGYVQTESQFTPRISATVGVSYDRNGNQDSRVVPRGALILRPAHGSVVKVLYGEAFRAPSIYERDYTNEGFLPSTAKAENVRTAEIVLEQRVSESVLATASLFEVRIEDLIRLDSVGSAGEELVQFRNVASARSRGAELQVDYRRGDGIWSYVSYSLQRAIENGEDMRNSPGHLLKAGVSTSTAHSVYGGIETRYEPGRKTNAGNRTDAAILTNLNLGLRLGGSAALTFSMRNLFDAPYATPAGVEHRQDSLAQDGRTFVIGLKVGGR